MRVAVRVAVLAVLLAACAEAPWPEPPSVPPDYAAQFDEWRADRRDRLVTPPSGPVLWSGLWQLPDGSTAFGSDPALPIVLPEADSPPLAGVLHRSGQEIRLEPAPGAGLGIRDGDPVDRTKPGRPLDGAITLGHDRSDDPTELTLGSLGLRIHAERGTDRLWLRMWDEDLAERATFQLPEAFPLDPRWRVAARYEPYEQPIVLPVSDVTDGTVEYEAPGEVVFRRDGAERRLIATAGANSSSFFIMMWDETAGAETYEGMRYMRVPFPDQEGWSLDQPGWTVIDFNRAYNPPCVFTAHSVCALPPRENYLSLAVTAGEMKPAAY